MYISVDESQMSVFFLDCFRFCLDGTEYNVLLNTRDVMCMNMKFGKEIIEKCL